MDLPPPRKLMVRAAHASPDTFHFFAVANLGRTGQVRPVVAIASADFFYGRGEMILRVDVRVVCCTYLPKNYAQIYDASLKKH